MRPGGPRDPFLSLVRRTDAAMTGGINRIWAQLIVEELIRSGVDTFCLASGYRNAPLAIAAVEHPRAQVITHYDERGAAFYALGFARTSRRAAAWITTSGTAVANGLPAIVEADADRVPVVLLTADRPPELQQTGANQAIDQDGIFRRFVRWSFALPAPTPSVSPAFVLTTVDQACFRLHGPPSGPVHLNCMFRAPLVRETAVHSEYLQPLQSWMCATAPYTRYRRAAERTGAKGVAAMLRSASRVLMVIGRLTCREDGMAALDLARTSRWPAVVDITSQVRLGPGGDVRIDAFDLCLEDDVFARLHAPDAVLYFGAPAVSKKLMQYLARHRPHPFIVIDAAPCRLDPMHQVSLRVQHDVKVACREIRAELEATDSSGFDEAWLRGWQEANMRVRRTMDGTLSGAGTLSEPFVVRTITRRIPVGYGLVVGNSMPVRDVDRFGSVSGAPAYVIANRGASGIDGTLATAAGASAGWGAPVTVILGDLAMLHDVNSLALVCSLPIVVVVINNNGGGIFHHVEIDVAPDTFERCFGTPHGLRFEHAARLFGLRYARVRTREAFTAVYCSACAEGKAIVIEVCTSRKENHTLREALKAQAATTMAMIKPYQTDNAKIHG